MKQRPINPNDLLQPNDPRFKGVYGYNPIKGKEKEIKQKRKANEDRKAKLEEKYWKMAKEKKIKPWDKKALEKIVLKEEAYQMTSNQKKQELQYINPDLGTGDSELLSISRAWYNESKNK